MAGACRGVRAWCVCCLLLGARSSRVQCLSGNSGGSAEVWIDYSATGEGKCRLTGGDFHIRLWCQHQSLNLGFHLERTCLTTGVSQGNPHRRRVGRSWYTGSALREAVPPLQDGWGRIRAQLAQPTWAQTLMWPQLAVLQMCYLKVDRRKYYPAQHHHPAPASSPRPSIIRSHSHTKSSKIVSSFLM